MSSQARPTGALLALALTCACAGPAPAPAAAPVASTAEALPPPPPPPADASDWLRRGTTLVKLGATGHPEAYQQAKEVLAECVARDPKQSECYLLLGESSELTDDEQGALRAYTQAVQQDPAEAHVYLPLAATYIRFKLYAEAEQVLHEGQRRVPRELKNAAGILRLYRLQAVVAEARGDRQGMVNALEAGAREGGSDPELDFELGTSYATLTPPRTVDALRSLNRFAKRVCRGAAAAAYRDQCELASELMQRLGYDESSPPPARAVNAAPVPPPPVATGPLLLPAIPELPVRPRKDGDAFTVWGASYSLRSRTHRHEVVRERNEPAIAVTGYIMKTNLADAPKCAVHPAGRADPENCRAPVPTFWLCDTKDAAPADCIRVLGWAANYAQIWSAIASFDKKQPRPYDDLLWGVSIPNPLPAVGAKVTVHGTYGTTFKMASSGIDVEPQMGLLTYQKLDVLEPAPELATLPGVVRKKR